MAACNDQPEVSKSVYFSTNIPTGAGIAIPVADIQPEQEDVYKTVSVVNDTDQDIKVTYSTTAGYNGEFIVPKSIKGFTKSLRGTLFVSSSFMLISLGVGVAAGNVSLNFSS